MELPQGEKRIGSIVLFELLGTALLCATTNITSDPAVVACMYFVALLLTFTITGGHLNPALTFCVYVAEGKWKDNLQILIITWVAQIIGAFLGLELGLLLRVIYAEGDKAIPGFDIVVPPIANTAGESYWLTVLLVEAIGTMIYAAFFLVVKKDAGDKDVVVLSFMMAAVYYGMSWISKQTSGGLLNPAIAISTGFNSQWNYVFVGLLENPLWEYFWIAWLVGPMLGALMAPFFTRYHFDMLAKINE